MFGEDFGGELLGGLRSFWVGEADGDVEGVENGGVDDAATHGFDAKFRFAASGNEAGFDDFGEW
nr:MULTISPECIES: hypothetical protein [Frankiaceae]